MKKNIIIAAGGTGGHVFPAICVANELQNQGFCVRFATDLRGTKYLGNFKDNAIIQNINTSSRLKLYISLSVNILKSLIYLLKKRPSMVIGFGGYPSVPFVFASQIIKIKTVIHEQNAVIGKANKLLSKMANIIITSFKNVKNLKNTEKVFYVGNPTRYEKIYKNVKTPDNKIFNILIFGGSQGASIFSDEIADSICEVSKKHKVKIFQQGRVSDLEKIKQKYDEAKIENIVSDFFENIDDIYQKSDLIISRSGASSLFEIIGFKKPSILIPYKKSINGDQEENAKFLKDSEAAIIIDETKISVEEVSNIIDNLIVNPNELIKISQNIKKLKIENVTKKFIDLIS